MNTLSKLSVAFTLILAPLSGFASNLQLELKRSSPNKIVGGVQLPAGERPWMVSLQSNSGDHYCGGSLIAPDWVLTAAHCVEGENASDIRVAADFISLRRPNEDATASVSEIIIHPDYNSETPADIALLRLDSRIEYVDLLSIADEDVMNNYAPGGTLMSVSGWGVTREDGEIPNRLRTVDLPLVTNEQCNSPNAYNGDISHTEICAGYQRGGKDSCQGDSGGPLVMRLQGNYVQTGIVSWGDGCARPDKYGVYARVASFNNWIADVQNGSAINPGSIVTTLPPEDGQLVSGVPLFPLSASEGDRETFELKVPRGAKILWIDITGGEGDADLLIAHGRSPDWDDLDFAPYLDGNEEWVLIEDPASGTWYISVDAYSNFDGVELMAFTR